VSAGVIATPRGIRLSSFAQFSRVRVADAPADIDRNTTDRFPGDRGAARIAPTSGDGQRFD
jgi:hypothetical protein